MKELREGYIANAALAKAICEEWKYVDSEDLTDLEDARAALAEAKKKGTVSLTDFKKELGVS